MIEEDLEIDPSILFFIIESYIISTDNCLVFLEQSHRDYVVKKIFNTSQKKEYFKNRDIDYFESIILEAVY